MGTNYYLVTNVCAACGRGDDREHIGKSSAGWCFSLHVEPENGLCDLADWERKWSQPGAHIRNEYATDIAPGEMLEIITARQWKPRDWDSAEERHWLSVNHAVPGPYGLARHRIDSHCIGHGPTTYDLVLGEFS